MVKREPSDWENFQNVAVTFWVVKPFDTPEVARAFLEILEQHGYGFQRVNIGWERNRWAPLEAHLDEYYLRWLKVRPKEVGKSVSLRRTRYPRGRASVVVSATGRLPFDVLNVVLEADHFHEVSYQRRFLGMAKDLYALVNPAYGMVEYSVTSLSKTGPIGLKRGLPGIFWGNFLGPEYTAMLGWERLEALARELPVVVERLPDDGVLILLGDSVLDSGKPEMLARAEAVERLLGEEYFSKTSPPQPLPFSMADALAGRVPPEVLRKHLLPPRPKQGKVPEFRFRELRLQRQEEWERSGGITVDELIEDVGLEIKGPGGVLTVDAATGKAYDLPGEMFGEEDEGEEE
jgi:hypothetical protein